jgi:hypothetical protein
MVSRVAERFKIMSIYDEELAKLDQECRRRNWDCTRLLQLAGALRLMVIKKKRNKWGRSETYVTCYKTGNNYHYGAWKVKNKVEI